MVMEVDVYKVGIYLSSAKDKDASTSFGKGKLEILGIVSFNIVAYLTLIIFISIPICTGKGFSLSSSTSDPISVGISLTFVRSVGANKVVDAIVEALSGKSDKYRKSLKEFEQLLLDGIGDGGVQNNDVIDFVLKGIYHTIPYRTCAIVSHFNTYLIFSIERIS